MDRDRSTVPSPILLLGTIIFDVMNELLPNIYYLTYSYEIATGSFLAQVFPNWGTRNAVRGMPNKNVIHIKKYIYCSKNKGNTKITHPRSE